MLDRVLWQEVLRAVTVLSALLLVTGCSGCTSSSTAVTDDPGPKSDVIAPTDPLVFALHDGKLHAIGADGKIIESFPAPGDETAGLLLAPDRKTAWILDGHTLHEVDLVARTSRPLATLNPPPTCPDLPWDLIVLQSPSDLSLTPEGDAICFDLLDRNINMANVMLNYRVARADGAATVRVILGAEGTCTGADEERICQQAPRTFTPPPSVTFDAAACTVTRASTTVTLTRPEGFEGDCDLLFEGQTPSARFVGVSFLTDSGDYIYRQFQLLDMQEGRVLDDTTATLVGEALVAFSPSAEAALIGSQLHILAPSPVSISIGESAAFAR